MAAIAAIVLSAILAGAGVFQAMLAVGKPWGEWAFGGQMKGTLPNRYRMTSLVSIGIYGVQIWHYLGQAHLVASPLNLETSGVVNWLLVGFFALGTLMNGISRSRKERNLWTPVLAVSLMLSIVVAAS